MNITENSTIATVVAEDYRAASVFERFGIDFCCKGNRTIGMACKEQDIAVGQLIGDLQMALSLPAAADRALSDYKSWPLDLLADLIEKKHHRYVTTKIPVIQALLEKIVRVHGDKHSELAEIKALFDASAGELTAHMKKEELIVFPFIRKMVEAKQAGPKEVAAAPGRIGSPIRMMMLEHEAEGERFRRIKVLSMGYTVPHDGCDTYRVTLATLKEFEEDLHLHIHLENNILFPGALELE